MTPDERAEKIWNSRYDTPLLDWMQNSGCCENCSIPIQESLIRVIADEIKAAVEEAVKRDIANKIRARKQI